MKYLTRLDPIDKIGLSTRSYNVLKRSNINTVGELIEFPQDNLMSLKNMGAKCAAEIISALEELEVVEVGSTLLPLDDCKSEETTAPFMAPDGKMYYDIPIEKLELSTRANNCVKNAGIAFFSQLLSMSESDLYALPSMGNKSVSEILRIQKDTILRPVPKQAYLDFNTIGGKEMLAQRIIQSIVQKILVNAGMLYENILDLLGQLDVIDQSAFPLDQTLQKELFRLPTFSTALQNAILVKLEQSSYGLALSEIKCILPDCCDDEGLLVHLLESMEQGGNILHRDGPIYERRYISVIEYAATLKNAQHRYALQARLTGKTLEDIGRELNLTRERVRQIVVKSLKNAPTFAEDRYAALYQKYDISESDFLQGFKVSGITYNYLFCAYKHGDVPISELVTDSEMPEEFRKAAERILYKNYVILNGERVLCQRPELSEYILRTVGVDGVTFEEFSQLYHMLLEDLGEQDNPKLKLMDRGYENKLSSSEHVLWKYGRKLRYYNIGSYDFTEFFKTLDLSQYHNVEYSTLKFFREYPDLMKDYDIVDEYELHNLLKKICAQESFPDLHIKRMPNIEFGTADRDSQMRELLLSLAPVENTVLAEAYENEYGVLSQTVLANYLRNFDQYFHAGIYKIDAPVLSEIMINKLRQRLGKEFYLLSEIRAIYAEEFPKSDPALLNPFTVKSLGYRVYANYAISDQYTSAVEYFRFLLTAEDLVDAQTLPKELQSIQMYTSEVYKLKSTYDIVEYEPFKYINFRRLSKAGVDKDNLKDFCSKAASAGKNKYFTVYSLREAGFFHPIDELGFGEWFYSSVLAEDKGLFSYRRMGSNRLFRCGGEPVVLADFLEWLLYSQEALSIYLYDLVALLKDGYNISIDQYKIIETLKDTAMYYDSITEKVYADYDVYFEEI